MDIGSYAGPTQSRITKTLYFDGYLLPANEVYLGWREVATDDG
jgi:hypothetical protein